MSKFGNLIRKWNEKYKNYIPADLWAFLLFILVFIIGALIIW